MAGVHLCFGHYLAQAVGSKVPVHYVEPALAELEEAACRPEQAFPDLGVVL